MGKSRFKSLNRQTKRKKKASLSFSEKLKQNSRIKNIEQELFVYSYHSRPFYYFHDLMYKLNIPNENYRLVFWNNRPDGVYTYEQAQVEINNYKSFLEGKLQEILGKYSISYWLHVSRRLAPGTSGDDDRPETIRICRNIIAAAIQKFAQLISCDNLKSLSEITPSEIFNGLLLNPEFKEDFAMIKLLPEQLVLTKFDEYNLIEYYQVEQLAFEMWFVGAKSRVLSKGANLIVNKQSEKILEDDRSDELDTLMLNFDNRVNSMSATATGTVFNQPNKESGRIVLTQIFADKNKHTQIRLLNDILNIKFPHGNHPNYEFVLLDIRTYLQVHMAFADDFETKWGVNLKYVIAVITDIAISLTYDIFDEKDKDVKTSSLNALFRSYRIYSLLEYKHNLKINWYTTIHLLGVELEYNELDINKAINYLTLNAENKSKIFVDTFGPLKIFVPGAVHESVIIDHSLIGDILYNLFSAFH